MTIPVDTILYLSLYYLVSDLVHLPNSTIIIQANQVEPVQEINSDKIETYGVRRSETSDLPGNFETFMHENALPQSPPRLTHTNRSLDEILSSISSTSSDPDDEHSDATSSSSVKDVTQIFNLNAPPPLIPSPETVFDVELPISVQNLESNTKVSFVANKNLLNYRRK
jgi:hypothetical protein